MTAETRAARRAAWATLLSAVSATIAMRRDGRGWLVGGSLRDALLGLPVEDVDLAVDAEPELLARAIRDRIPVSIAVLRHDTVRVGIQPFEHAPPLQLDLTRLHGDSIEADLRQRDFTVNAMALPMTRRDELLALMDAGSAAPSAAASLPSLIDPLHGRVDLARRTLVPASEHALRDEPGRIIRAARLAATYGFALADKTREQARAAAPELAARSPDRLREELSLLLAVPRAAVALAVLRELAALPVLFPELTDPSIQAHAIAAIQATEAFAPTSAPNNSNFPGPIPTLPDLPDLREWYTAPLTDGRPRLVALRFGLLLHARAPHDDPAAGTGDTVETAAGSPASRRTDGFRRLHLPAATRRIAYAIDLHATALRHLLAGPLPDDATARRAFAATGDDTVDVLVAAAACDTALASALLGAAQPSPFVAGNAHTLLERYFTDRASLIPPPLLSGRDLITELGLASGPAIRELLDAIRWAQLGGEITTRDEALTWARAHPHNASVEM